jgi:hypothetical protein
VTIFLVLFNLLFVLPSWRIMTHKQQNPGCLPRFLRLFGTGTKPEISHTILEPELSTNLPYRLRDDFLSAAEASFFRVLQTLVQDRQLVFPKVSLSELFFVSQPEQNQVYFNKINRKVVDFVLCDPKTLKPSLAIELDDSSHQRPDRIARDEFVNQVFKAAGLPIAHIPVRESYQTQEIAQILRNALSSLPAPVEPPKPAPIAPGTDIPICPKCGIPMVVRVAQRGANAGQKFYGCPNYPKCREVIAFIQS